MRFHENLKTMRTEKGLTQGELAQAIDVKSYTIGDLERQRSTPDLSTLIKLADVFECSVDYLLGRENDLGLIEVKENNLISAYDHKLLQNFKPLSKAQKKLVLDYIEFILKNVP